MYSRRVDDRVLTFGVSGKLWKNALVMYDRQTRSLWSHITGECLEGPLKGARLTMVSSIPRIRWQALKAMHPNCLVLSVDGAEEGNNQYLGYETSDQIGIFGDGLKDHRLPAKQMVVGIRSDSAVAAVPLSLFQSRTVLPVFVGKTPLAVIHDRRLLATLVYRAEVAGKVLRFPERAESLRRVTDRTTQTEWDLWTGQARKGPLAGNKLDPVPAVTAYWFAWCDYYPDTELVQATDVKGVDPSAPVVDEYR